MSVTQFDNIPVFGEPDAEAIKQMRMCSVDASYAALMADHHLGYSVPIGGVVAYENKVSPSAVGYDIACGNKAVLLDVDAGDVQRNIKKIMDDLWRSLSFGMGRNNKEVVEHPLFDDASAWEAPATKGLKDLARQQLGTIGGGNHYVDLFVDEKNRVWCGVHFGSRGLGHKTTTYFLKTGGAKEGIHVKPLLLDAEADLGEQYIQAMQLAGRYAYAGRDWVCEKVAAILGAKILKEVHNHHNFAWQEEHFGRKLWVVRKGATPSFPGQQGFVGGSMGDISVILEGAESELSKSALYSTVHGAGRVMSRRQAAGQFKFQSGKRVKVKDGKVSRQMMHDWISAMSVELRGAGTDESPHCYKRLPEVLAHHENTIRILHTLKPIGVLMAGEDELDPFAD